jgi:SAM-dependent methyltransferase
MTPSIFAQLSQIIHKSYPNYSSLWDKSYQEFGSAWEHEISENIAKVFGCEPNKRWNEAVDGYAEFCTEALRAQVFFEKNGRYQASNYQEVLKECYHSADYMERRYLPGQYLSHSIWPHHQRMLQHFINVLLPKIAKDVTLFYEVGVGCGMYSQKTLQTLPQVQGVGYDISDYALDFTMQIVSDHGLSSRYKSRNQDIIASPIEEKCDFVISQEVLEHLEDPQAFIHGLYAAVRPGGWSYITAAINAAHTDHIYLYRSPDEVRAQIENAGWKIVDTQIECNYPEKPIEQRPTIAGFLAHKD